MDIQNSDLVTNTNNDKLLDKQIEEEKTKHELVRLEIEKAKTKGLELDLELLQYDMKEKNIIK
jgi:hypothetical protein